MFATEQQTEDAPTPLADIVREVTDDGRLIVQFLFDMMQGKIEESTPWHQLEASRQLAKLGFKEAQTVIQSASRSARVRAPSPTPGNSGPNQELADIIKLETSDGRDAVRFLVDVMQGNLGDFKPHHRIAAAKELLRRGFDSSPGHTNDEYEDHDESFDDDPGSPNYVDPNANRYNNENDPFDFENYDEEQYRRDGHGGRALMHIYGNTETMIVAIDAANHSRHDAHIPDRDFTPTENPEDDPYGKGSYGYNALRFRFRDNQAIRAANQAVAEYKKRKAERPEEETAREGPPVDLPSCCFPQPTAPSSSEDDDTMPPDHWSLKYMERIRNRSIETDESSKDPDPPSSVPPERPQNPPVGAGFKPDRGLARPSTGRESKPPENPDPGQSKSHKLSDAKDPPRKRPVKIFVGHRTKTRANAETPATSKARSTASGRPASSPNSDPN